LGVARAVSLVLSSPFVVPIKAFAFDWNRRQLYRLRYPKYQSHLFQFVYP
jgi:hypothetical protein